MDLHITLDSTGSLTRQIYDQIRNAILSGRLQAGDPVPSSRELAASLGVARNTVATAVDHLRAEGFLSARPGVGTSVSNEYQRAEPLHRPRPAAVSPIPLWRDNEVTVPDLAALQVEFDFRAGIPDASRFPFPTWRRLIDNEIRRSNDAGLYSDPSGPRPTREAIARHLAVSRGLLISPEEIVITNGVQQAVTLLSQVLVEPGDVVAVEDPGYPPARRSLEFARASVIPVPVDEQGIVVDRLPSDARLVYVTPAHQFPLGVRMSLARRAALLDWAEANDAAIIEDDYDTDFRYGSWPIDPLHALDDSGRVIYVGSFSKTMLPSLRLGYCVAPRELVSVLRRARFVADWHGSPAAQMALGHFIAEGRLAAYVRSMRRTYQGRRDRLVSVLDTEFRDILERIPSVAGLHIAAWARNASVGEVDAWAGRAAEVGIGIDCLHHFAQEPTRAGLIFGFGAIDEGRIDEGLRELRRVIAT